MTKNVLLAGETWLSAATHFKGFDQFGSVTFHSGIGPLKAALAGSEFELTHMPAHEAVVQLPFEIDQLSAYDVILLSDIGASSLLLHPDVWLHGRTVPNRLRLLRDYAARGGGLGMVGGYLSFQGIDGRGRWRRTPVEEALPVECLPFDDRIEAPEGFRPVVNDAAHPILRGVSSDWPFLLGANEVVAKPNAHVIASLPEELGGHPLLVAGTFEKGRTLAWTSDLSPHWLPASFSDWPGYSTLWRNALAWLSGK